MKLENQVCSLEQAKELNELGIKRESLFVWKCNSKQDAVIDIQMKHWISRYAGFVKNHFFSAFTVAELGVMLPNKYLSGKIDNNIYNCWQFDDFMQIRTYNTYQSETESEARASMLIHLLENKIITADEVNKRLTA